MVHLAYKYPDRCNKKPYHVTAKLEVITNGSEIATIEQVIEKTMDTFDGNGETIELKRDPLQIKAGDQVCVVVNEAKCIYNSYGYNIFDISLKKCR